MFGEKYLLEFAATTCSLNWLTKFAASECLCEASGSDPFWLQVIIHYVTRRTDDTTAVLGSSRKEFGGEVVLGLSFSRLLDVALRINGNRKSRRCQEQQALLLKRLDSLPISNFDHNQVVLLIWWYVRTVHLQTRANDWQLDIHGDVRSGTGIPKRFQLGKEKSLWAWEFAVPSMRRGEVAMVIHSSGPRSD
jgi:hypothetical protein